MFLRLALLLSLAAILAACAAGASTTGTPTTAGTPAAGTPAASAASAAPASPGAIREVAVTMTDALRFEPAAYEVKAGERVRFVVTNAGKIRHEFFVGDAEAQRDHEEEMRSMGMAHDEENGISVDPGQTKSLEMTFDAAGETLIGCHEPGHYDGGMRAAITIRG